MLNNIFKIHFIMIPTFLTFYYDPDSPNEDWEAYRVKGLAQWHTTSK